MFDKESSWYGTDSEALSILFAKRCDAVEKKFDNKYREFYDSLERLMDMTYRLACHHVWMFGNPHLVLLPKNHKVIFAALHKNFFVFYSAMALAKKGLFGPSSVVLHN